MKKIFVFVVIFLLCLGVAAAETMDVTEEEWYLATAGLTEEMTYILTFCDDGEVFLTALNDQVRGTWTMENDRIRTVFDDDVMEYILEGETLVGIEAARNYQFVRYGKIAEHISKKNAKAVTAIEEYFDVWKGTTAENTYYGQVNFEATLTIDGYMVFLEEAGETLAFNCWMDGDSMQGYNEEGRIAIRLCQDDRLVMVKTLDSVTYTELYFERACPHTNWFEVGRAFGGHFVSTYADEECHLDTGYMYAYGFCEDCGREVFKLVEESATRKEPHDYSTDNGTCYGCGYDGK